MKKLDEKTKLLKLEQQENYKIFFTGGLAHLFNKDIKGKIDIDKNLTVKGLIKISKYFKL